MPNTSSQSTWTRIKAKLLPKRGELDPRSRPVLIDRLPPMMLGALTFPIGFFIVGWTSNPDIHWFPSLIGFVLIGMSFLLIFQVSASLGRGANVLMPQSGINYLIDAYTKVSASAVGECSHRDCVMEADSAAANTFNRSLLGAAFPLIAQPLFHNLGINWACTLLGCLAVLLGVTPYLFYIYGKR